MAVDELLAAEGIAARVVAMPSWELFAAQDEAYPPGDVVLRELGITAEATVAAVRALLAR